MNIKIDGVIYCYTSPTGKKYVGQTIREQRRKCDHRLAADSTPFHNAVRKYGYESMLYEVLHRNVPSIDKLNQLEREEIKRLGTLVPKGYNLNAGGKNALKHELTKDKIRQKAYGRQISEETRQKLRDSHKGKTLSPEARAKVSAALKGRDKGQAFRDKMKEVRNRPEMKEAVIKAQTGRKRTGVALRNLREGYATSKILCITTGKEYQSIKEASIDTGVNRNSISRDAKGLVTGRKYRWAYV